MDSGEFFKKKTKSFYTPNLFYGYQAQLLLAGRRKVRKKEVGKREIQAQKMRAAKM